MEEGEGEGKGEKTTQENIYKLNLRKHQGDYHDQVGLIPETQGWLVIINITNYINEQGQKST